jgi:glycerophosphoryl diester phosphodiesterase
MDSDYLDADIVKAAHKKHLKVNTWTVNDVSTRDRVLAMGVDQVTGNFVLPQ